MRTISFWAGRHVLATRFIIILGIYPLLNLVGWFMGEALASEGVIISTSFYYLLSLLFLAVFVVYPYKNQKKRKHNYAFRKTLDISMAVITLCFVMVWGNNLHKGIEQQGLVHTAQASLNASSTVENNTPTIEKGDNPVKKLIKNIRKKYKNASKDEKTGMIVLAVVVAVALAFLLGALACNIACAGSEAGALVLLVLGLGAIAFGLARVIRRIKHGPRNKEPETSSS